MNFNKSNVVNFFKKDGIDIKKADILYFLISPSDFHGHGRLGCETTGNILHYVDKQFACMYLMPNVQIPIGSETMGITSYEKLVWYKTHINEVITANKLYLLPLFTFYLSPNLSVQDIRKAWQEGLISGIKYYPKGGTTNSENGLQGFSAVKEQLLVMQELDIPLNIHGETPTVDGVNPIPGGKRELVFYSSHGEAEKLLSWYKGPVVCEHITTAKAVDFVKKYPNVYATITPQHLLLNDMALFHKVKANNEWYKLAVEMGMVTSIMCMPVLKPQQHVNALWNALIWQYQNQTEKFFLGTDTAWHPAQAKAKEVCACGVWNSPVALEMYWMVFSYLNTKCSGIINDFQRFCGSIGAKFYQVNEKVPDKIIAIVKTPYEVPTHFDGVISPFGGETLPWKAIDVTAAFGI